MRSDAMPAPSVSGLKSMPTTCEPSGVVNALTSVATPPVEMLNTRLSLLTPYSTPVVGRTSMLRMRSLAARPVMVIGVLPIIGALVSKLTSALVVVRPITGIAWADPAKRAAAATASDKAVKRAER